MNQAGLKGGIKIFQNVCF